MLEHVLTRVKGQSPSPNQLVSAAPQESHEVLWWIKCLDGPENLRCKMSKACDRGKARQGTGTQLANTHDDC